MKMKDSGIAWIGEIPEEWELVKTRRFFSNHKQVVGEKVDKYERLALTMNGVIKRSKDDSDGLQPERFETYQILHKNELIFKLIDLENIKTSRVGLSPYTGLVSPAYIVLSSRFEDNRFFYYWFMFMYYNQVFNNLGGNGVRSALNAKDVLMLPVPNIQFPEQRRIADYLDRKCSQIDAIIARQQEVIEKLKAYKLSVITEAVTKGLNPHAPMKDSGVEWIGEIPEQWENRKMISILSMRVVDGPHESPELYDEGIPYISATAVENGKTNFDLMRGYISEEYCNICDLRYKPQLHDILVIKLGASTGQVAIVETTDRFNIWVPLAAVRCNEKADPYFVYYAFQSDYFLKQMEMSWTYGTQQTLGVKSIERLRIMLPTLEEQKEIVCYLKSKCDSIDAAVKNKEILIDKLADYKKSLIYEVVTGKKEV